jgi:arabinosaccharide transport system permease protein
LPVSDHAGGNIVLVRRVWPFPPQNGLLSNKLRKEQALHPQVSLPGFPRCISMNRAISFLTGRKAAPFVFLTPFLILLLVFKVWPVILAVTMSFSNALGVKPDRWVGVGFANYIKILGNARFQGALGVNTLYTIGTLLVLVPVPLVLAAVLDSGRVVKSTVFRVILFLPALTSLVVVGTLFRIILATNGGLFNTLLQTFLGIPPQRWLEVANLTIPSLIILATWRWTGINILYFNSGLVNIPRELYEAASIDGANAFQMFYRITLPLLRPITFFVTILTIIGGYQVFVEPFILYTAGTTPGDSGLSVALYIYQTAFTSFQLGQAAAMGVILALIICAISLVQFRFFGVLRREA